MKSNNSYITNQYFTLSADALNISTNTTTITGTLSNGVLSISGTTISSSSGAGLTLNSNSGGPLNLNSNSAVNITGKTAIQYTSSGTTGIPTDTLFSSSSSFTDAGGTHSSSIEQTFQSIKLVASDEDGLGYCIAYPYIKLDSSDTYGMITLATGTDSDDGGCIYIDGSGVTIGDQNCGDINLYGPVYFHEGIESKLIMPNGVIITPDLVSLSNTNSLYIEDNKVTHSMSSGGKFSHTGPTGKYTTKGSFSGTFVTSYYFSTSANIAIKIRWNNSL